jgi:hypothetical protein
VDEYVQAILDALWDIPDWPKNEMIDRRLVRRWIKRWPPTDNVDLLKLVGQYDTWSADNPIGSEKNKSPRSRFERWVERGVEWGSAAPEQRQAAPTGLSVQEQLRLKDVKRRAEMERMGMGND